MNLQRHWRLAVTLAALLIGGLFAITACGTTHYTQPLSPRAQFASWWNHYGKTEANAFQADDKQLATGLETGTLNSDVNADIYAAQLAALAKVYVHWPMPPVDARDWRTVVVAQGKVGNDIINMNYDAANSDLNTVDSALTNFTAALAHFGIINH